MLDHPQVEVLARDRAWAYRLAGHTALPEAQQVADRFHLVHNVGSALKEFLHSERWNIPEALGDTPGATKRAKPTRAMRARWEAVQQLKGSGQSVSAIARELGMNRNTVSKYLAADRPPVYAGRPPGPSKVRPYLSHLRRRWAEGCHSARRLYHEIVELGYDGAERHVRKAVHPWRSALGRPPKRGPTLNWLVLRPYQRLTGPEKEKLKEFLQANPPLARGHKLKEWFGRIIGQGDVEALDAWVKDAAESGLKQFGSVARGFRKDYEAIKLALTTPWSTGQCEGQICRVKLVKRMGYGRAKPDLLRQRVLHRLAA
ncbi:MAG: transposase [Chloroflexi bacterium]|nr:transposase [Chloroflexota bacterium]